MKKQLCILFILLAVVSLSGRDSYEEYKKKLFIGEQAQLLAAITAFYEKENNIKLSLDFTDYDNEITKAIQKMKNNCNACDKKFKDSEEVCLKVLSLYQLGLQYRPRA